MDLYVLRHGIAADRDHRTYPTDGERPLTPKGIRRMGRQVKGLRAMGLSVDAIVTSPLVRAIETAEIAHKGLKASGKLVVSEELAPNGDPFALMDELGGEYGEDSDVMIVGHEPYLSDLVSVLAGGVPSEVVRLRKGALCKLRLLSPRYGRCGWIEWSLTPKQMVRLR